MALTSRLQHRPVAPRFRPRLEALEERWLPSTLTVTNFLDDGSAGTLRAAIAGAQSGNTIVFDSALSGQTITLTSGKLVLNKNLTIQGPGADQLTISGGGTSRVFEVAATTGANTRKPTPPQVTLSGLTIRHDI